MAASTRSRVSGDTSDRPLITFDTVGTDTPACAATFAIVGRPDRRASLVAVGLVMDTVYRKFRTGCHHLRLCFGY
jgi:hypothetical protein